MHAAVQELIDRWIASERANDGHQFEEWLADDFRFVGPAGFVLDKQQYAARFDGGQLRTTSFAITDLDLRSHDQVIVGIGIWTQETSFQGRPNNGNFRLTMILTGAGATWRLLSAHLSPMMLPPA